MISLLVGVSMALTADISAYCNKAHYNEVEDCIWYVKDCVMDGEKPLWCIADYEQALDTGKEE